MKQTKITKWQKEFLDVLAECGNISHACRVTKIPRYKVYRWKSNPIFLEEFILSHQIGLDLLWGEAIIRAYHGYKKPVYYAGKIIGYQHVYSDTLLIFLLKALKPEVYSDNMIQGSVVNDSGKVKFKYI